MDIIEPTVERQYGGGLDDAYMTLSQRRDSAFAAPDATSAFASPMSQGGLPTIYREAGGGADYDDDQGNAAQDYADMAAQEEFSSYYSDPANTDVEGSIDSQGNFTGGENQSPSLASLVDQGIIDYDEAYKGENIGRDYYKSIQERMLEAERGDRSELAGEYESIFSGRGLPSLDPRSVRSLSKADKDKVQDLIDDDKMQGLGIPLANLLEDTYKLRTYGKGLRGGYEVYSQGRAKNAGDPDYINDVDAPEDVKRLALEFRYAKPGETMKDFAIRFEEETGRVAPLEYFGFDRNSDRDMNKNAQDVNAAMQANNARGALQGGLMFGSLLTGPATAMSNLATSGYRGEYDSEGNPISSTPFGELAGKITGGISDLASKGKEAIFGPGESEFKQREAIAREQLGREPTLEEVNKVNVSGSGLSALGMLKAIDDPLGTLANKIASGRPTTYADIARERNQEAMTTKDLSREGLLELVPEPSLEQKIEVSDKDRETAAYADQIDRNNKNPNTQRQKIPTSDIEAQQRVKEADRINSIIDSNIKEREEAPKQESKSFGQQIIDFFSSAGSPAIPDESTNLGPNDTVERKRVAQPTQKQVAAIAQEAAKIPEEVQKTITSAGLLPQYLALIRAGYTAERAITAIGLSAGTAIA